MANSTAVDNATLVHIAVTNKSGKPELSVFPIRHGDTIAFSTKNGASPSPHRPREVVWVGHDIPPAMRIEIKAKARMAASAMGLLPNSTYSLTSSNPVVRSGEVPKGGNDGVWSYDVTLFDGSNNPLHSIDPDIIIHPDP